LPRVEEISREEAFEECLIEEAQDRKREVLTYLKKSTYSELRFNKYASNIIGHILGDGCICLSKSIDRKRCKVSLNYIITYGNSRRELIDDFITNFKKTFKYENLNLMLREDKKNFYTVTISNIIIFFSLATVISYPNKIVPKGIFNSSRIAKISFIRALMDDEAWVDKGGTITFANTNISITTTIINLLKEFGFKPIYYKQFPKLPIHKIYYCFRLPVSDNFKYYKLIGFIHKKKKARLKNWLARRYSRLGSLVEILKEDTVSYGEDTRKLNIVVPNS